jgi:hypothetical protein
MGVFVVGSWATVLNEIGIGGSFPALLVALPRGAHSSMLDGLGIGMPG